MNIKLGLVSSIIMLSFLGCTEKNKEYYESHIEKAEQKNKSCEELMKEAFRNEDKNEFEKIAKDETCNITRNVVKEHRRNMARIKNEIKQKEYEEERLKQKKLNAEKEKQRLKKEAEKKVLYEKEYLKQVELLNTMNYLEFENLKNTCSTWGITSSTTAICKAYIELKEKRKLVEISDLKQKYPKGNLEIYRDKTCKGLEYNAVYCELSTKATYELEKETIEYYVTHRSLLKKDFNECQKQYIKLQNQRKWQEKNELTRIFKCSTVGRAAAKLKVYSFSRPIQ